MTTTTNYFLRRAIIKERVINEIMNFSPHFIIRGSWKYNDFHLDFLKTFTYSDIDLIAPKSLNIDTTMLKFEIEQSLKNILPMKVSIHFDDHLSNISIEHSKVKFIYEYLISYLKTLKFGTENNDYFKAKTIMMLMRTVDNNQRFKQICDEIGGKSINNLYKIKIGEQNEINLSNLTEMIHRNGDQITKSFITNCVNKDPNCQYIDLIRDQFHACTTISDWLKNYIEQKRIF